MKSRALALAVFGLLGCEDGSNDSPTSRAADGGVTVTQVGRESLSRHEVSRPYSALSSGRGTYFLAARPHDGVIIEVDSATGDMIRTIGGIGEGPGEYRDIGMMLKHGDSLLVQNPVSGALAVYAPDGEYVRTQPFAIAVQAGGAIRLRGDTTFVAEPVQLPGTADLPLHLVAPSGTRFRSFGAEDRTVSLDFFTPRLRALAKATDSSVWVARRDRYEVELWNTRGDRERRLAPVRDWFPPMTRDVINPAVERPETQLGGVSVDVHGHLVVVLLRARTGWQPRPTANPSSFPLFDPLTRFDPFEAVIEVLDPDTGALLAGGVFTHLNSSGRFLPNGLLMGYTPTPDEAPALAFWSISHDR